MKNQYVGDVCDFAKYGLLRWLSCSGPRFLRLGLLWYLTADSPTTTNGSRIGYLKLPRPNAFSAADSALLDKLMNLVSQGRRHTEAVIAQGVLPPDTSTFDPVLTSSNRAQWFDQALERVAGCDLVFLDPDNGLARSGNRKAPPSHATLDEVHELCGRGHSVAVIQFPHRQGTHNAQLQHWSDEIARILPASSPRPSALRWRSHTSIGFIVVPSSEHLETLAPAIRSLLDSEWGRFFTAVPPSPA